MYIEKFVKQLKELDEEIQKKTELLETGIRIGLDGMPELLRMLEALLPDWFFFIEQTGIGTKERILFILSDMEEAIRAEDSILLGDALQNGLGFTAEEYIKVIEEALHEE